VNTSKDVSHVELPGRAFQNRTEDILITYHFGDQKKLTE
jgi:hypothetical protein